MIRCAIFLRSYFSINQLGYYIIGTDCVPARFFAGVLAGDQSVLKKVKSCRFADVSYPIQLLFGDRFRIGSANNIKFFLCFSHADNRLFQYPVPSRCYLHYRGLFSPCSPQNPVQNSFPPLNRAKQGIHSKPFYIKAFERLTPEKH